jgi:hypothetical protein
LTFFAGDEVTPDRPARQPGEIFRDGLDAVFFNRHN